MCRRLFFIPLMIFLKVNLSRLMVINMQLNEMRMAILLQC